ncbi:MAG: molybdopterin-dependent oxidoreductase [Pseudomonadota bacterium]
MSADDIRVHHRTCNLCEAMCGIEIHSQGDEIVAIRGDRNDPLSRGHICPKAVALQDLHNDPDRLRHPVRRTADGWEQISWEEAFTEVVSNLRRVQQEHGRNAIGFYAGNPTAHNHGALLMLPAFIRALRTRNRFSATSVDQLPHMLACLEMFGNQTMFPIPDIDRTDFFLCIGANPLASNGSIMTAPDIANRLKAIGKRKGRVVVVDPRRTETAEIADEHLFVRPGTDALLVAAMINVLFAERKVKLGRAADFTDGIESLQKKVRAFTPEKVAPHCGIPADRIRELALDFAQAKSAIAYCRVGTCTSAFSAVSAWLVYALNIITGNLDRPGGVMFPKPAVDVVALAVLTGQTGHFGVWKSRVRGLPEFGGELPAVTMAEEILTPGDGQIRAMVTHAGNPVLSTPNGKQLDAALGQLDYMVSIDIYINETTRHANIILPPTGHLEHAQFDPVFHAVAIRNTVRFAPAMYPKPEGSLHDWEILLELTTRLDSRDFRSTLAAKAARSVVRALGDEGIIDLLMRIGPYGNRVGILDRLDDLLLGNGLSGPLYTKFRRQALDRLLANPTIRELLASSPYGTEKKPEGGLTLAKVQAHPHGIDIGPLEPALPERLATPDKTVNLAPSLYAADMVRLADRLAQPPEDGLLMIGRRHVRSNNSWMHNSYRLVKGRNRCTAMIHPQDAAKLGVTDDTEVEVVSRVGSIRLPAEVTDAIMPGVVSVPHGFGHGRDGVQLSVAREVAPGASMNDVTDELLYDHLTGMAIINGVPVTVRPPGAKARSGKAAGKGAGKPAPKKSRPRKTAAT